MSRKMKTMDGNMAAAHVSYAFTETAGIYPITPSSDMPQYVDQWAANGLKNIFGETVKVVEMQSEAGAAGTVHGSLQAGALTTTYTASQGLLLMIPNMYKIAGELLPAVFHVSARTLATHALSIFGDQSDIYATRQTGFALLASGGVQEVMDLAPIAHLAAIKGRVPFLHFFDGFRTSHELQKIEIWDYEQLKQLVDWDALAAFRARHLNPNKPVTRGTAQNPDVFFQWREAANKYYLALPAVVEEYMKKISQLTGKDYQLFNYYGDPNAENMVIAMGSVTETLRETVDYLRSQGEKVGVLAVHLYRPFSLKHFIGVIPKSVKRICVLDKTKEPGALGEPLYLDVRSALWEAKKDVMVIGGRYGLSSKDTTSAQMVAVYNNLKAKEPKNGFSVGIKDDVTFQSLDIPTGINTVAPGTVECKFYGLGSDGTVGANKNSIKIIGDHTDMYCQGYFAYDSKKSGGITTSHLRFGKTPIRSIYLVNNPNFVSCSVPSYVEKYDMLCGIREGGTFLLNCHWSKDELLKRIPNRTKKIMAENKVNFYVINATKIAAEIGLGNRTNTVLQSAFFKLSNVMPYADAVSFMKQAIKASYGKKGDNIVAMNEKAVDMGADGLEKIDVDPAWAKLKDEGFGSSIHGLENADEWTKGFLVGVADTINRLDGDLLPVSAFEKYLDGTIPCGTAAFEKRGIAVNVPAWKSENCIQCNQCVSVCPHAAIRPFLLDDKELAGKADLKTVKPIGKGLEGLHYKMQVSPLDCTGCGVCVATCPAKTKALEMVPLETQMEEAKNWDYISKNVTYKDDKMGKDTIKGAMFARPLFEFSGACAGCGETAYIKMITQLFGDRMMVANATGCSSIYGASCPSSPYTKNAAGKGPAWNNSLFEDNAEFGYGYVIGVSKMRERVANKAKELLASASGDLKAALENYLANKDQGEASKAASAQLTAALQKDNSPAAQELLKLQDYFIKRSIWVFGGDGWGYDIGYGGVDHVLASNDDINVLVLDTEVYSNTGGQASKSTPVGPIAKFAAGGKRTRKKDLGKMAMSYGNVYVAQVAVGANQAQLLKALHEAETYPGPSLIIAYAPCINHGIKAGMSTTIQEEKFAVESGYWHLYRFNPLLEKEGKNPFQLDSKEPDWTKYMNFLAGEVRYASLKKLFPEAAEELFARSLSDAKWRYNSYCKLAGREPTAN